MAQSRVADMDGGFAPGRDKYRLVLALAQRLPPVVTAVVHPCDAVSLQGALEAHRLGLITPILVAPPARLAATAAAQGLDISGLEVVPAEHSHDSAAKAVALVREAKAEALMKGSLHTDELMGAVVCRSLGIRTARRISHCFIMDVPGYAAPLIITDAAVNIAPTLAEKVDIVQNAIDLAHALGLDQVRVAILSATETVNPKVPSTVEAAALCKMADRGQITGGLLDGPLALDNAIDPDAAALKHICSPVAGKANVLVVPDLEAGNMLAKSLSFLARRGIGRGGDRRPRADHPDQPGRQRDDAARILRGRLPDGGRTAARHGAPRHNAQRGLTVTRRARRCAVRSSNWRSSGRHARYSRSNASSSPLPACIGARLSSPCIRYSTPTSRMVAIRVRLPVI
jgi:phosphate acetyltransferase